MRRSTNHALHQTLTPNPIGAALTVFVVILTFFSFCGMISYAQSLIENF